MKINLVEGQYAQQVKREAQKKISAHIKVRVHEFEMKEVVGQ